MSKTKKEILANVLDLSSEDLRSWMIEFPLIEVPIAMEEYAKQTVIEVLEFINSKNHGTVAIQNGTKNWLGTDQPEKLYSLYLKSKQ